MNDSITPAERPHHPLGPSSLQAVEACPCYVARSGGSEAALMGTLQHGVTESRLDDNRLDDDQILAAAECIDFYEERLRGMQKAVREEESFRDSLRGASVPVCGLEPCLPVIEVVEEYLPIDDLSYELPVLDDTGDWTIERVNGTTAGYIDRALIAPSLRKAEAMDWKFGAWPVEHPSNNVQGMCYTLGLFNKFPDQFDSLTFWFKQPKLNVQNSHTWNRSDIPAIYTRICTIVARAQEARKRRDFSMANPTIPNCLFCKRLGNCPAVAEKMLKVGKKFSPVEVPDNITPSLVTEGRDVTVGLNLASLVKAWADAFRSAVTNRVIRGEADIPAGQSLVSTTRRLVANTDKFKAVALQYMTEAEFLGTFTPEFGATEKVIATKAPRGQKGAAVEAFGEALEAAGAVKKSAPVVFLRAVATQEEK